MFFELHSCCRSLSQSNLKPQTTQTNTRQSARFAQQLKTFSSLIPTLHMCGKSSSLTSVHKKHLHSVSKMMQWVMGFWHLRRVVLLAVPLFACLPRIFATLPPEEIGALRDLCLAANIPWDESQDPCTMRAEGFSVVCRNDHVTDLFLRDKNMTALPESISQLQGLQFLELTGNLPTSLPESVGQLGNLRFFFTW